MRADVVVAIQAAIFFLLNLFIFFKVRSNKTITRSKKMFMGLALTSALLELTTSLDYFHEYSSITLPDVLHFAVIVLMFIFFATSAFFWFEHLRISIPGHEKLDARQIILSALPITYTVVVCIASYWTHWVFYIDNDHLYARGPLVYLQTCIPYVYAGFAIFMVLHEYIRGNGSKIKSTTLNLFLMMCPSILGAIIQMILNIDGGYAQIGVSLGMIMIFFNLYLKEIKETEELQNLAEINKILQETSEEKKVQLERLMTQYEMVRALSSTYVSSHVLNVADGSFQELETASDIHSIVRSNGNTKDAFDRFITHGVAKESQDAMRSFTDPNTIAERLKDKNTTFMDYVSLARGWCRANWLALSRDKAGNVTKALYAVSDVNQEICAEMKYRNIIKSLSWLFNSVFLVNMSDLAYSVVASNSAKVSDVISGKENAKVQFEKMCKFLCKPEHAEPMRQFCNLDTINERMKNRTWISQQFESYANEWTEGTFLVADRNEDGSIKELIWCTKNVDEEKRKEQEYQNQLAATIKKQQESLDILSTLSRAYVCLYYVDINAETFSQITTASIQEVRDHIGTGGNAREKFVEMSKYLVPKDMEQTTLEFTELTTLSERLKDKQSIQFSFLGAHVGWCVGEFIVVNRDENGNCTHVLWGIRSVQGEKQKDEEHKKELQEALALAEAANKAKTTFLNNMSHDIRTPMNAILGFSQLMEKEKNNPQVISDYLTKMQGASEYLLTIINNVLDMARIESGKMTLDESVMDLREQNKTAIAIFEQDAKKKNIDFRTISNFEHPCIMLDVTKVKEIATNLLSNAMKYTPEGGSITLEMRELPCDREGYGTYAMIISDTGIGMSKEFQEHIFESFTRERNSTESKVIGTGLGMSIVKKLVDFLGGTITVESELGKGSTFTVTLIHKIVDAPEMAPQKIETEVMDVNKLQGKRILIAEDNDLNAEIAITILEENGMKADRARDGAICVKMLNNAAAGYYSLVLMDVQMPILNGYDATRQIRQLKDPNKANIPIVAMTANAFDDDKKDAFAAGMNGHLAKPLNIPKLMEELNNNIF